MKNSVKIITILGAITYFFPVYSMMPSRYYLHQTSLKAVNPLSDMNNLKISRHARRPSDNPPHIPDDDPLFADEGLALSLAVIKILEESDKAKNEKVLKTIRDSVSQRIPVRFNKRIIKPNCGNCFLIKPAWQNFPIVIIPSEESYSVFTSIEDWIKTPVSRSPKNWLIRKGFMGKDKKNAIFTAIFQGERDRKDRKERLAYIRDELPTDIRDEFVIEVPEDLISIIVEYLPGFNVDEDRTRCIEQAEKKFHEKQKSRFTLFKKST